MNLTGVPQDINSIRVLPVKNKSKNDPTKKQNIDFDKTFLFKSILNLIEIPQGINSIEVLPIRSESRNKCSGSILDSIGYN